MAKRAARDLHYTVDLLAADGTTVIVAGAGAGIEDLSGRRVPVEQIDAAESTHRLLLRYEDGRSLPKRGFVRLVDPHTSAVSLYVVDWIDDPREPRARVWLDVFAHIVEAAS